MTSNEPTVLAFRDGHLVEIVDHSDAVLRLRHTVPVAGRLAGPHWHPELTESFRISNGAMRFRIDGRDIEVEAGGELTVRPRQVHEFWSTTPNVAFDHEIRPSGRHREMFETWHRLDAQGRTNSFGVPRNPLDIALLWDLQEGYLAHIPPWLQRATLGPLARWANRRRSRDTANPAID